MIKIKYISVSSLLSSQEREVNIQGFNDEAIYDILYYNVSNVNSSESIINFSSQNKGAMFPEYSNFIYTSPMCSGLGNQVSNCCYIINYYKTNMKIKHNIFYLIVNQIYDKCKKKDFRQFFAKFKSSNGIQNNKIR